MTIRQRMTVWPGQVVPLPQFEVWDCTLVTTSNGTWIRRRGAATLTDLPTDFWLRDLDLTDLDDPESITDFARQWGKFCDPDLRDVRPSGDWYVERAQQQGWLREGKRVSMSNEKVTAVLELGLCDDVPGDLRPRAHHLLTNPIEVADRLNDLRGVANQVKRVMDRPDQDVEISEMMSDNLETLNYALSPFSVQVAIPGYPSRFISGPSAYSIAALQIANDISEEATLRYCANETCPHGRDFIHQRGRAEQGQYRTRGDLKYCSSTCAQSQAQRERRRRVKSLKGASNVEAV